MHNLVCCADLLVFTMIIIDECRWLFLSEFYVNMWNAFVTIVVCSLPIFSWVKLIVCCRCHISNQFRIALFWAPFKVFVAFRGMVSIHIFVSIGVHIRIIDSNTTQIGYTKRRVQLIQLPKVFVINLGISYRKSISAIDCLWFIFFFDMFSTNHR